ncbi:hypothetical protein V1512DRAFT_207935 [Lipomyces arxii]|uniref:uncharacterized protein n=1 Tax=Lipomyces arxii TaxID=56418 RepID=UPI0034CD2551
MLTLALVSLNYSNILDSDGFPFLKISIGFADHDSEPQSTSTQVIPPENLTAQQIQLTVIQQYEYSKHLAKLQYPIEEFAVCTDPMHTNESATVLVSQNGPEGTLARVDFGWYGFDTPDRFNPSILPYPKGSENPYFTIARQSVKSESAEQYNELVFCDMDWGLSRGIQRRILTCKTDIVVLNNLPEWRSPNGSCIWRKDLHGKNGYTDPRLFFSPIGEPLMVVGNNGKTNCLSQYVIDLRALIPDMAFKLNISDLPIRYKEMTELPRAELAEVEKNWFLLYDDENEGYVQHEMLNRSITALDVLDVTDDEDELDAMNIVAGTQAPQCISSLVKHFDDEPSDQVNSAIHQGTNSLRVTLCEYPCIPTIHNTVLIEMFNVKYHSFMEIFYRRYIVVMNVTAPFEVIGRTNNLIYAGSDEKMLIFTTSMVWDHDHFGHHPVWDEAKFGGRVIWDAMEDEEAEEIENKLAQESLEKGKTADGTPKSTSNDATSVSNTNAEEKMINSIEEAEHFYPTLKEVPLTVNGTKYHNPLVNDYHGWIDDTIMLSIGINDRESGVVHVKASNLLDCLVVCS